MTVLDAKTAHILRDLLDESRWYPEDDEYPGDPEIHPERAWRALRTFHDQQFDAAVEGKRSQDPILPLEAVALARVLVDELRQGFWYLIYQARKDGDSWTDIGNALGVSRQSAHEMYAKDLEKKAEWWKGRHGADRFAADLPKYQSVLADEPTDRATEK
jgi:hypothetical protein